MDEWQEQLSSTDWEPALLNYQLAYIKRVGHRQRIQDGYLQLIATDVQYDTNHFFGCLRNPLFMEALFLFVKTPVDLQGHSWEMENSRFRFNIGCLFQKSVVERLKLVIRIAHGKSNKHQEKIWRSILNTPLGRIVEQIPLTAINDPVRTIRKGPVQWRDYADLALGNSPGTNANAQHDKVEKPYPEWTPADPLAAFGYTGRMRNQFHKVVYAQQPRGQTLK